MNCDAFAHRDFAVEFVIGRRQFGGALIYPRFQIILSMPQFFGVPPHGRVQPALLADDQVHHSDDQHDQRQAGGLKREQRAGNQRIPTLCRRGGQGPIDIGIGAKWS